VTVSAPGVTALPLRRPPQLLTVPLLPGLPHAFCDAGRRGGKVLWPRAASLQDASFHAAPKPPSQTRTSRPPAASIMPPPLTQPVPTSESRCPASLQRMREASKLQCKIEGKGRGLAPTFTRPRRFPLPWPLCRRPGFQNSRWGGSIPPRGHRTAAGVNRCRRSSPAPERR
jgi:hypothetical protein